MQNRDLLRCVDCARKQKHGIRRKNRKEEEDVWFSHNACVYIFHRDWRPRIRTILFATKREKKKTGDLQANFAIQPSTGRWQWRERGIHTRDSTNCAVKFRANFFDANTSHFSFKSFTLWSRQVSHSNANSHCCQSAQTLNHQNFLMKKFRSSERRWSEIFIKYDLILRSFPFKIESKKKKKKQIFVVCLPKIASVSHTHICTQ